jgi:putative heme-binding domain-containing protein
MLNKKCPLRALLAQAGILTALSTAAFPGPGQAEAAGNSLPFELRDGDRVVLLGDTLIEREQAYGYLEERLTSQFPDRNILFRNLGWSADTPAGESRASFDFDKPGKGFEKLKEQLAAVQPTVVVLGYGMASSFAGLAGLEQFKRQLNQLLDSIQQSSTNGQVRFVLLSPIRHENLGPPLPEPSPHNQQLALYVNTLREIGLERRCEFVSLFDLAGPEKAPGGRRPLTENGIHLSPYGYARAADEVANQLRWKKNDWRVTISAKGNSSETRGTTVSDVEALPDRVTFTVLDAQLVNPRLRDQNGRIVSNSEPSCALEIHGLKTGDYELKVDGSGVRVATAKEWGRGVTLDSGAQFEQAEALRQAILRKNELYFDRWRPQNETYLFGFRKHEQGQNAKEIPMFDPLVQAEEAKIAKLREPVKHMFELVAVKPGAIRPEAGSVAKKEQGVLSPAEKLPEQPRPTFEAAPGLEVNLFAESPLLAKPTQMNFDPQGRLWIASSAVYPQIQPGQIADDKILVLEDTNGDGFAEKSTVFADGLFIPTCVIPGDGGAYVGQSTELLHFKDVDGDGKADTKRIVLSAFGTEDTHHMVHTLQWGPDGQLYFNQSIYIHTYIETPHGVERLNSGGIWHLRPGTGQLGVFLRGFCNPWGHAFDEFGQSFITDGAGYQGVSFGIPGATYFTYANMRRELKSISPGSYPKFCGLEILRSEHFPAEWQGNAITCDFRAHRVVRFAIEEQGSGYAAREVADVLRSTNLTFRPIDVKLGPDGALYVADWSNPIIQHGEVDFRDPRRDHEHGRIWRVTAKGRPLNRRPALVNAPNRELLEQLLSVNAFNQQQARRVLTERGPKIVPDLASWTKAHTSDPALLESLWMHQAIDVVEPRLLEKVLAAKDGRIRAAAMRVVSYWHPRLQQPLELLTRGITDPHPRVRLEAMRALAQIPSGRSAELVLSALDRPMDAFLDYGVWLSINDLATNWLATVKDGTWKLEGREKQLEFALKAIEPAMAGDVLAQVLQRKVIPRDGTGPWLELIGSAGDEALLRRAFEQILRGGFDAPASARALEALNAAARERQAKPTGRLADLKPLLTHSNEVVRAQALRLAGNWKLHEFVPQLVSAAVTVSGSPALRQAALDSMRDIGGKEVVSALEDLTAKTNPLAVRQQAVLTLASLNLEQAAKAAVPILMELPGETVAADFWRSLLSVKNAGPAIASALPKSNLPKPMAKAGLRAAREGGRNEPDLVWALTRGANLDEESQSLSASEIQELAAAAVKTGDPVRGEKVFRRKDLGCVTCHAIGGAGGKVGPDLTSIGASAQPDYLVESILYPNRKIKEGYSAVIIETKDGMDLTGVLANENQEQLVLRDATGKEIAIAKNNIQSRVTGKSLMPAGLADSLKGPERLDLYRFLTELGKPGPFDASKGNVARSWKLFAPTPETARLGDENVSGMEPNDPGWLPVSSFVDGRLSKSDLSAALEGPEHRDTQAVYAAARFQVGKAGTVSFKISGAEGASAWVDGRQVQGAAELKTELPAGPHTFLLKLEARKLPEAIRLESPDATFLMN